MGKLFDLDSPVMSFLSKMADLMILNLLTLLCCIPIITIGDAVTALYYMTLKMVKNEETYIVKGYFKSFKENFKQATIVWVLALALGLIFYMDFTILKSTDASYAKILTALIMIVVVVYVFTLIYLFPVLSRFVNTVRGTVKNSFLMSVLNLPKTILLILINLIPVALLFLSMRTMPLLIMFGFSVPAYIASMLFAKIFKRFEPQEDEAGGELETLSFIKEEEEAKRAALQTSEETATEGAAEGEVSGKEVQ